MNSRSSTIILRYAFLAIVLLVAAEIIVDLYHAHSVRKAVERMGATYNSRITLVHELRSLVRERMITLNAMLLTNDPFAVEEHYTRLLELGNAFIRKRRRLEQISSSGSEEEQRIVAELRRLGQNSQPVIHRVISTARAGESRDRRRQLLGQILPQQQKMLTLSESIFHFYLQQVNRQSRTLIETDRNWLRHDALMGGVTLLLIAVIGIHVIRRIERKQRLLATEIQERAQLEDALRQSRDRLDETVRLRTEELAQRTEQLYEAQRLSQMGCWEWDLQSGALSWSEEFRWIIGIPKDAGQPSLARQLQQLHPDDRAALEQARQRLPEGEEYRLDYRVLRDGGETAIVHERAIIEHFDEDGEPAYVLGTVQDISERKKVEEQLRLTASVVANTGDGVMITDSDNRIVEINRAFSDILGYREAEIVGQEPRVLKSEHHEAEFYGQMWQTLRQTGQWQGEVWDRHREGHDIPLWMTINTVNDEQGELRHYVALFRDISQSKQTEQRLWHSANHDSLTGLPNRNLLYDRLKMVLADAGRAGSRVAVMLLDLDGFKQVNDTHGHDAGDALLSGVAQRLRECVRDSDTVARFAGDEFVIVIRELAAAGDAMAIADKVMLCLQQPQDGERGAVPVEASIGIALFPDDADESETLLKLADDAMYRAKRLGKNRYRFAGS